MLIPSRKYVYTKKWKALGQRVMSTYLFVSFDNGQSHIMRLTWNINENKTPKTWFELSSERVIATEDFDKQIIKDMQTIDPKLVDKKTSSDLIQYVKRVPTDDLLDILRMAGIIDKCNPKEGMKIVKQHISNVEKWMKKKKPETIHSHIKDWLDDQKTIGIQRIPVHHSLFSSNMDISSCIFYR